MRPRAPENYVPLIRAADIDDRVAQLGRDITRDFADRPLTALVVLKGSFIFAADLIRHIALPLHVEFIGLRSYGDRTSTSGVVEITMDLKHPVEGQHILIIEDIVDSGLTIDYLRKNLETRSPSSVSLAALLHKPTAARVPVTIDYRGFEIADRFVVGYGLDHAGLYRNLPDIGYLDPPPA